MQVIKVQRVQADCASFMQLPRTHSGMANYCLKVLEVPQMKVATEEHRAITVITAAKQTLLCGRSQTYGLSHIVEGGINLTELDVMTDCMAIYPNYLVPERMKGPGQVLRGSQKNNSSFLHLHAGPTRL